jgi:hypothetical protein
MRYQVDIVTRDDRVVAEDALVEYHTTAESSGLRSWAGRVLDLGRVVDAAAMVDDPQPRLLRLSDGSEGEVIFTAFPTFVGTGPPPKANQDG